MLMLASALRRLQRRGDETVVGMAWHTWLVEVERRSADAEARKQKAAPATAASTAACVAKSAAAVAGDAAEMADVTVTVAASAQVTDKQHHQLVNDMQGLKSRLQALRDIKKNGNSKSGYFGLKSNFFC